MNSALLTVAIIVLVILAAVIAVQRVKYKNLVQQTNQSMKDLQEKESIMQKEAMIKAWADFKGRAQELDLPSAPKQFLHYFEEDNCPQTKLHRNLENGMAVSIGRLREDTQYDYKFVCLAHNTLRGAAGGAVLLAELLCAEGYMD